MDLELCIRDRWCKKWPTRELVHLAYSLAKFLDVLSKGWSLLKNGEEDLNVLGLSACAEWILNLVQEIGGVKTDQPARFTAVHILFRSFLVCEAKSGLP